MRFTFKQRIIYNLKILCQAVRTFKKRSFGYTRYQAMFLKRCIYKTNLPTAYIIPSVKFYTLHYQPAYELQCTFNLTKLLKWLTLTFNRCGFRLVSVLNEILHQSELNVAAVAACLILTMSKFNSLRVNIHIGRIRLKTAD